MGDCWNEIRNATIMYAQWTRKKWEPINLPCGGVCVFQNLRRWVMDFFCKKLRLCSNEGSVPVNILA